MNPLEKYNNIVIKNIDKEFGKEIIQIWKDLGIDTIYKGVSAENEGDKNIYYGIINKEFDIFNYTEVQNKEILILS